MPLHFTLGFMAPAQGDITMRKLNLQIGANAATVIELPPHTNAYEFDADLDDVVHASLVDVDSEGHDSQPSQALIFTARPKMPLPAPACPCVNDVVEIE